MDGSCAWSSSTGRFPRLVGILTLGAVVVATPAPCLGQDLRSHLSLYNAQVAKGQFPDAERTARTALDLAARTGNDDAMRAWLINLGDALRQERKVAEAEPVYWQARALVVKHRGPNDPDIATLDYYLAIVYRELARNYEAEALFKQAIAHQIRSRGPDHQYVANGFNGLAQLYRNQARYAESESAFLKALAIYERDRETDPLPIAAALTNLGLAYTNVGRFTEAEKALREALAIRRGKLGPDHPFTGATHYSLGRLYEYQGRFDLAETEMRQGLTSNEKAFGRESSWVATILNGLGNLLNRQSRTAEAERHYGQALAIFEHAVGADHPDLAVTLNCLAGALIDSRQEARAEPLLKRALAIQEKALGTASPQFATTLHNLGESELNRGRPDAAEPLFRRALTIYETTYGPVHPDVCGILLDLARAVQALGKLDEARRLLDRTIGSGVKAGVSPKYQHRALIVRAELSWQAGARGAALDDLREALRLAEDARGWSSGAERERATLFASFAGSYERMVQWQAELGGVAEALQAIEQSRARSLLDEMATAGYDLNAGRTPQERLQLERDGAAGRERVARLEKQLSDIETDPALRTQAQQIRSQLAVARDALYQHDRDARATSPVYRQLLNRGASAPALDEIRQQLCVADGVLLEYLVGKDGGYVIAIGPQLARLSKLELNGDDARVLGVQPGPLSLETLRAALAGKDSAQVLPRLSDPAAKLPADALAALWRVLVPEDVRKGLTDGTFKRLTVVPDGPLAMLPFEALVVEPGEAPRYLLDAGPPIVYAPSATVLISIAGRKATATRPASEPVLALGDPAYPERGTEPAGDARASAGSRYSVAGGRLARLPYSGWEAQWVSKAFNDAGIKAASLSGPKATEAAVRYWAPGRKILHLACHGLAEQTFGNFYGGLALAPGPRPESNQADDGYLQFAEICALDLKGAELAILSACQTNFGPEQIGEGTWTLSRGFLVAGARRVVASNWLVDDEAAASLVSVYSSLLARAEKAGGPVDYAAALRDAKRWVRAREKWQAPYYWSTLVLVGPP